ncbi:PAS domain-containing protein [Mucilaginibacter paludis]|uniref:histidine kinase n=1 Tax=Mucilaginibacter paludis DSM 18603 TaxID=714943 RepID=H1Y366_9SPHI|nr:PAS domain-containing protein [Mucilaginibacter paludis]EHQ28884.1 PAS/PAC sensor signal transduction histidine kinase [Mucilaginibacter paludis DSM 18603]
MDDFLKRLPNTGQTDIRLFAAAVSASNHGVVITDHTQPDEPIIYCNKAFESITGYTNKEIIGHNCRFLQDGDNEQEGRRRLREAIKNGEHCQVEIRNYKKNGRMIWNELMISPVKDRDGNVTNFIGIQNDITRRKEAEDALASEKQNLEERVLERTEDLQESEAYLASIIETIRESLVVLDEKMRVLSVNDHFCRFFKVAENDIRGRVLFEHNDGQWNLPELRNLLINVLPNNNPFEGFEIENEFPNIGRKLLVLNARQVTLKGKYQNRILLAIEDITEQREIEQRKEDFISIASHEMKTPLTSIKGNLQLLQRKAQQNNDTQYLSGFETASKSIARLEKLIYDLLDVSKIQSGKVELIFSKFNFQQLIIESVNGVQATTQTHKLVMKGSSDIEVTADFGRLEQVLLNLLNNAVKYSPTGKEVIVHTCILPEYVKVSITDTGVGIHERDHKRIFERFYRADQISEKFPGVGIGLYVSNEIIKEHRGTLWVESQEGKGAVFSFTIPINR